jgi:hypothetical protein
VAEAGRRQGRDVVVPGHDEERRAERPEEPRGGLVLGAAPAVREVAGRQHERGVDPLDEVGDRSLELRLMKRPPRSDMQIRDMKDAC